MWLVKKRRYPTTLGKFDFPYYDGDLRRLVQELLADDEKVHFHPGTGTKALLEKFPPMGFQVVLCRDRHVPGLILIPSEAAAI